MMLRAVDHVEPVALGPVESEFADFHVKVSADPSDLCFEAQLCTQIC